VRRRLLTALAVCVLGGVIGVGSASAAVPRAFYGIVQFTALTPADFNRMGAADVGTLRVQFYWPSLQTSRNAGFNFSGLDSVVGQAAQHAISVLPILYGTPPFEAGGCSSRECSIHIQLGSAQKRGDWQAFVRAVAQRYGPNGSFWAQNPSIPYFPIRQWQVWNEQNGPVQRNPAGLYAQLLSLTDSALHGVDPGAKIMVGGMFGTPKGSKKFTAWRYLSSIYSHGGGNHFDAVALHPYSPTVPGTLPFQIKKMRRVLKSHHDGSKRLYITEIGWGSSKKVHGGTGSLGAQFNVGPTKQAKNLKGSFRLLTSHRKRWKIGGVDWFTWKDPANPPPGLCAFCYSSGLYRSNGTSAKPALRAYKSFTQ
jgi:hypothetical protein